MKCENTPCDGADSGTDRRSGISVLQPRAGTQQKGPDSELCKPSMTSVAWLEIHASGTELCAGAAWAEHLQMEL